MGNIFISKHAKERFYRRFPEIAYKTNDPYGTIMALIKAGTRERCNKATSPYNGVIFRNGSFVAIARRMNKRGRLCVTTIVREH